MGKREEEFSMAGLLFLVVFLSIIFIVWETIKKIYKLAISPLAKMFEPKEGSGVYKYDSGRDLWIDTIEGGFYEYNQEKHKFIYKREDQ